MSLTNIMKKKILKKTHNFDAEDSNTKKDIARIRGLI